MSSDHVVIFSHGFGVRKDDRGLLSDIAENLPEASSILFDYFDVDEAAKTITVRPVSAQARMLNEVIDQARAANPGAIVDLICHSQGTVVAALAKPKEIRKTILLTPVFDMGLERTLKRYGHLPDSKIDLEGISKLPSVDGLVRIVPAEYWRDRKSLRPFELYNALAKQTELIAIIAGQDQLLGKVDLRELSPKVKVMTLDGNHNFEGEARRPLIETLKTILHQSTPNT